MNTKLYLKNIAYFLLIILSYLIIITTFTYFDILSIKIINIISFIFINSLFLYSGFTLALKNNMKGYLSGLTIGIINIMLLFTISLILRSNINTNILLYFLILLLSSTIGGMFGINYNNKENDK